MIRITTDKDGKEEYVKQGIIDHTKLMSEKINDSINGDIFTYQINHNDDKIILKGKWGEVMNKIYLHFIIHGQVNYKLLKIERS